MRILGVTFRLFPERVQNGDRSTREMLNLFTSRRADVGAHPRTEPCFLLWSTQLPQAFLGCDRRVRYKLLQAVFPLGNVNVGD